MIQKFLVILLFTFSFQVIASTNIPCNDCTNYSSYFNKAVKQAESKANKSYSGFAGEITVLNAIENKAHAWYINASWIMRGGDEPDLQISVYTRSVSPEVLNILEQLHNTELFKHLKRAKTWGIEVPESSGLDSSWDIARSSTNHDKLDNWYHENYPVSYWTRQAIDIAGQLTGVNLLTGHQVKFIFADGSTARFKVIEIQTGELTFTYVSNTAQDKDGNRLADQGTSFAGEYTFSTEQTLAEFLDRVAEYGVPFEYITISSGGGGAGSVTVTDFPKKKK